MTYFRNALCANVSLWPLAGIASCIAQVCLWPKRTFGGL